MRTPHEVLGIAPDATLEEAEDAYHRLLRTEHPDLHHGAGADRVARAEQRTRELNAAISSIRDGSAARVDVGTATRRSGAPGPGPGAAPGPDDGIRDRGADGWEAPGDEPAMAACPWCGRLFVRAVDLKDHVFDEHDLRLDRRERSSLLGGRVGRAVRAAAHLPLWAVVPVNALFATVVGVLVTSATDDLLGWWSAGIAMAPTAVALIDRLSDIEL